MESNSQPTTILFDPLLTEKFFQKGKVENVLTLETFPGPPDRDLETFFKSKEGVQYKEWLKSIADDIIDWLTKNDLKTEADQLRKFYESHYEYSGSNAGNNQIVLPLYQQGIPALARTAKLLRDDRIPYAARLDGIKNLCNAMAVCPPGVYTHITDLTIELLGYLNTEFFLQSMRRKIMEQVVNGYIRATWPNLKPGLIIHYINGTLNYFSEPLGIDMLEDEYVNNCDPKKLENIIKFVQANMTKFITAELFLQFAVDNLPLIQQKELDHNKVSMLVESLEKLLNTFGEEKSKEKPKNLPDNYEMVKYEQQFPYFYQATRVIQTYDNLENATDKIEWHSYLTWQSRYLLFLSITQRLTHGGFLDCNNQRMGFSIPPYKISYLSDQSLMFSFVVTEESKGDAYANPFLCFIVEQAIKNDGDVLEKLRALCTTFNAKQKHEIIQAFFAFLNSEEFKYLGNDAMQKQVVGNLEQFISKLKLPPSELLTCIVKASAFYPHVKNAIAMINKGEQTISEIIHTVSTNHALAIIRDIDDKYIQFKSLDEILKLNAATEVKREILLRTPIEKLKSLFQSSFSFLTLTNTFSMKNSLLFIKKYQNNPDEYRVLLLALVRIYQAERGSKDDLFQNRNTLYENIRVPFVASGFFFHLINMHHLGDSFYELANDITSNLENRLFKPFTKSTKITVSQKLAQAIASNDTNILTSMSEVEVKSLTDGDLGMLFNSFKEVLSLQRSKPTLT